MTQLLQAAGRGDARAADELIPLVYGELRKLADSWLGRLPEGQTLQPTALVHEAYLRLVPHAASGWENRRHFFFAAARAMHDILVEHARHKASLKTRRQSPARQRRQSGRGVRVAGRGLAGAQ